MMMEYEMRFSIEVIEPETGRTTAIFPDRSVYMESGEYRKIDVDEVVAEAASHIRSAVVAVKNIDETN